MSPYLAFRLVVASLAVAPAALSDARASERIEYHLEAFEAPDPQPGMVFGWGVAGIDDIDGDARRDLLLGAPATGLPGTDSGRAYIVSGADRTVILRVEHPEPQENSRFGESVLAPGDLNGDQVPDFAVSASIQDVGADVDSGRVYVFDGGTGEVLHTLDPGAPVDGANFGASLSLLEDIDGDRVGEIVVGAPNQRSDPSPTRAAEGYAYVFSGATGEKLRTLRNPAEVPFGSKFGAAVAGLRDVSGDGVPEIAVGAPWAEGVTGRIYILSGADGGPLKTLSRPRSQEFSNFGAAIAASSDLDGDGFVDLIAGASGVDINGRRQQGEAYLLGKDGTLIRTLSDPAPIELGQFGTAVVDAGDVNRDGIPDFLVDAGPRKRTAYLLSGRSGAVIAELSVIDGPSGAWKKIAPVGDLNGDGVTEFLFGNVTTHDESGVLHNNAYLFVSSVLSPPSPFDCNRNGLDDADEAAAGTQADCDDDGFPDICALTGRGSTFDPAVPIHDDPPLGSPDAMLAFDVDGDGDLDLASANTDEHGMTLFRNGGDGSFGGAEFTRTSGTSFHTMIGEDLDLDGDTDLIISNVGGDNVIIAHNNGDEGFHFRHRGFGARPTQVVTADFNEDGFPDVAFVNESGFKVSILLASEEGKVFVDQRDIFIDFFFAAQYPSGLAAGDFDKDGHVDLVVADAAKPVNNYYLLRGDGEGGMILGPLENAEVRLGQLVSADLDLDGDLDVASVNAATGDVVVLENRGGSFLPLTLGTAGNPQRVLAIDIDGDVDIDLVTVDPLQGATLFINRSGLLFHRTAPIDAALGATSMTAGDLDGDGDVDLACVDTELGSIFVLRSQLLRERAADCDSNSTLDSCDVDIDESGVPDACEQVEPPTDLTATTVDETRIIVRWEHVSPDVEFEIVRRDPGEADFSLRFGPGPGVREIQDHRLTPGSVYTYRVRARRAGFQSSVWSNEATARTVGETTLFHRGDPNDDAKLDISDAVFVLAFLFNSGTPPGCLNAADANDDDVVDISDAVTLLVFSFSGGAEPPSPGPPPRACGADGASESNLGCERYDSCSS